MITFQGENIFLSLWINNYLGAKLLTKHTWLNVLLSKFSCSGDKESTLEGTCTLLVLLSKWIKSYYCTSFRTDNAVSRINYLIGPSTFRISRNQKTIIPHTIISSFTNSKIKTETDQCKLEIVCKAKLVESEVMPVKTWFELVSQGREETHFLYKVANIFRSAVVASISRYSWERKGRYVRLYHSFRFIFQQIREIRNRQDSLRASLLDEPQQSQLEFLRSF